MEKTTAFVITLAIMLLLGVIGTTVWYSHQEDQTFVKQCNMAGGTAVISGTNKCYKGDNLLYSDAQ